MMTTRVEELEAQLATLREEIAAAVLADTFGPGACADMIRRILAREPTKPRVDTGTLINRAATLGARAVVVREAALAMPIATAAQRQTRLDAIQRGHALRAEADQAWKVARAAVEKAARAGADTESAAAMGGGCAEHGP